MEFCEDCKHKYTGYCNIPIHILYTMKSCKFKEKIDR